MAIILENRRAIAVVKNKAQRDFIMQQLIDNVKSLNLAADRRPSKPFELTEWELSKGTTPTAANAVAPPLPKAGGSGLTNPLLVVPKVASPVLLAPVPASTGIANSETASASSAAPPSPAAAGLAGFGSSMLG